MPWFGPAVPELDADYHLREWTRPDWDAWRARAEKMLGRPPAGLATQVDGVAVPPLRADDDRPASVVAAPAPGWRIVESLDGTKVAEVAAALAEAGVGGAAFAWRTLPRTSEVPLASWSAAAQEANVALALDAGPTAGDVGPTLAHAPPAALGWDPLAEPHGTLADDHARLVAATRAAIEAEAPTATVFADGTAVHDGGRGPVAELGVALGAALVHLRASTDAGLDPAAVAARTWLRLSVGPDVFAEIAKLRAARALWSAALVRLGLDPSHATLVATTSWRRLSRLDAPVNLLRHTTAAFAAVVGGADLVEIRSHVSPADTRTRRWARNIHHLLAGEAWLSHVADPAAGSATLEHLTRDFAAAAWPIATRIAGDDPRAALAQVLAEHPPTDRPPQTGVDLFPDPSRPTGAPPPTPPGPQRTRRAAVYEEVRARIGASASPPTAVIELLSPRADVRAELAAARDVVARLGLSASIVDTPEPADLVVLCGTPDAIARAGEAAAARAEAAGARVVATTAPLGPRPATAQLLADPTTLLALAGELGGAR